MNLVSTVTLMQITAINTYKVTIIFVLLFVNNGNQRKNETASYHHILYET